MAKITRTKGQFPIIHLNAMLRADKQVYLYEHQTKIQDKCCYHITTSDYNGDHLVIVLFCVLLI
jgi:carbonic anhydrase/acetyltransferase-like protein (isoleucine patch superfamily)